ncbi:MAG: hypothetical protein OEV78_00565 [Spirochaetia bacterium]|nr:hypothetical protein [Spirochaetia bacterium]
MILNKKSSKKKYLIIPVLAVFVFPLYSKAGDWLWKIDKQEYTLDEFSNDYKSYLQLMSLQMGTSTDALLEYINKAENIADPRSRAMAEQMNPGIFGENYMTIMLLKKHAAENHYFEKKDTIQIEKFLHDFTITQLYLNNIISKIKVDVKDEDVESRWLAEREKNENYKTVPIEEGLLFTKQNMIQEKRGLLKQEFVKSLYERYKIEKNIDYKKMLSEFKVKFN